MNNFPFACTPDLSFHLQQLEKMIDMFYGEGDFHIDKDFPISLEVVVNFAEIVFEDLKRRGLVNGNC